MSKLNWVERYAKQKTGTQVKHVRGRLTNKVETGKSQKINQDEEQVGESAKKKEKEAEEDDDRG